MSDWDTYIKHVSYIYVYITSYLVYLTSRRLFGAADDGGGDGGGPGRGQTKRGRGRRGEGDEEEGAKRERRQKWPTINKRKEPWATSGEVLNLSPFGRTKGWGLVTSAKRKPFAREKAGGLTTPANLYLSYFFFFFLF